LAEPAAASATSAPTSASAAPGSATGRTKVSLGTIFVKFVTIGAVSFGGGIVAYLQRMLVDDTKWLTPDEFLACLEISQTMPGLNAVNMSVLVGDKLRGPIGATVAFVGMVLPGYLVVWFLGFAAGLIHHSTPIGDAAIRGVAGGAVGLLAAITVKTGTKQFANLRDLAILLVTFAAMSFAKLPLWLILVTLGPISIFLYRPRGSQRAGS
jgi:chromate transporter